MLKSLMVPLQLVCQLMKPGSNIEGGNITIDLPDLPSPYQATDLPPGFTAFPEIGTAYRYFSSAVSWNTARENCIAHDSSLAVIDSFTKVNIAKGLTDNPKWGGWIGAHRLFGDGEWLDLNTGSRLPKILWKPDNSEDADKKCLLLSSDGTGIYSAICTRTAFFFCEIPLRKNGH